MLKKRKDCSPSKSIAFTTNNWQYFLNESEVKQPKTDQSSLLLFQRNKRSLAAISIKKYIEGNGLTAPSMPKRFLKKSHLGKPFSQITIVLAIERRKEL